MTQLSIHSTLALTVLQHVTIERLQIYQRGCIWWIRYYRNGEEFNESSRSEKEAEARKLLKTQS